MEETRPSSHNLAPFRASRCPGSTLRAHHSECRLTPMTRRTRDRMPGIRARCDRFGRFSLAPNEVSGSSRGAVQPTTTFVRMSNPEQEFPKRESGAL